MTRAIPTSVLIACAVLLAAGCGKKDEPAPAASSAPAESRTAAAPPPPLPEGDKSKGGEVQQPQPGQANDHSNPAFKAGGAPDKNK
jgi:hypothetical protein